MAKVNPTKVKRAAEKEERAGRFNKAIALYRQLLEVNPRDWNTVNKIGDLFAKQYQTREATQEYAKVADYYTREGVPLKAIAVWKKVVRLDPSALDPYIELAELYSKQGLLIEAKSQYRIVVDEYLKRGKPHEAGDALRRMADIGLADLKLQNRLAELYIREGRKNKAVEVYIAVADQLNQKGHLAESMQVLQKGLKVDPSSSRLRLELARIHLLQKSFDKAISLLKEARQHAPDDPAVLSQLGEAYLGSNRVAKAEQIYRRLVELAPHDKENRAQMGRLYLAKGDLDAAFDELSPIIESHIEKEKSNSAISLIQEMLARDPDHAKSLVKLVEIHRIQKNDTAVVSVYSNLSEVYIKKGQHDQAESVLDILVSMEPQNQQHHSKLEMVRQKLGGTAPTAPGSGQPKIELSGPLSDEDQDFIDEHLAEGRVFRKYGLADKAAEHFLAVVARFADHVETREELCDVYKEKGDSKAAADEYLTLAEIHRLNGDETKAQATENEARGLSLEGGPATPDPAPMAEPAVAAAGAEPGPIALDEFALAPEREPVPLGLPDVGDDEAADPIEFGDQPAPFQIDATADDDDGMSGVGELSSGVEDINLSLPEPELPAPLRAAQATPSPVPSGVPPELQKALQDIEQCLSFGFVDDAREALRQIQARHADHPAIQQKVAELGLEDAAPGGLDDNLALGESPPMSIETPAPAPEPSLLDDLGDAPPVTAPVAAEPPPAAEGEGMIDLGAELGHILGGQSAVEEPSTEASDELGDLRLTEIFDEFEKGVDQQLGQEDYGTRYNLGIAYKEMGLVDKAISEFQLAAKDPNRVFECSSMLGACFIEKSMPKIAVNWFQKALQAPGRNAEEYAGLRYDLASAYEAAGDVQQAVSLLTELYAENSGLRDVATRLRELKAASQ